MHGVCVCVGTYVHIYVYTVLIHLIILSVLSACWCFYLTKGLGGYFNSGLLIFISFLRIIAADRTTNTQLLDAWLLYRDSFAQTQLCPGSGHIVLNLKCSASHISIPCPGFQLDISGFLLQIFDSCRTIKMFFFPIYLFAFSQNLGF